MKSIKPGRGRSAMSAAGAVCAAVFGVFWTIMAITMKAPFFFPLMGILFVVTGIVQAVYCFKNAAGKQRFSEFDIVDSEEEPDAFNQMFARSDLPKRDCEVPAGESGIFCPYCGAKTSSDFKFCRSCGRKLP